MGTTGHGGTPFAPLILATTLALFGGCGDEIVLDGAGIACLSPAPEWPDVGQVFEADAVLYTVIEFDDCLSSSCDTDRHGSCTMTVSADNHITIESQAGYTDESGASSSCTSDCVALRATCETTGPLAEGTYTVTYGAHELTLEIPTPGVTGVHCLPLNSR